MCRGTVARFLLSLPLRMEGQPTVLIVDDEPGVRESLRATLAGDCTVHVAVSSDEALSILEKRAIDVVTLDLRMPGIGGMGVLECIKRQDPDIEAIIITGYSSQESRQSGMRLGAFAYVSKPFDIMHVRELVQRAAARRWNVRLLRDTRRHCLESLAHALHGPLAVLLDGPPIAAATGTDAAPASDAQRGALEAICHNSSRLLSYLEDLFLLFDLQTGDLPYAPETVCVTEVLLEAIEAHRSRARAKGVCLTVQADEALRTESEGHLLRRLTDAILDNAVKFTDVGEIVVTVIPAPDGPGVTITVQDTGVGMSPERTAAILADSNTLGVGLGLRLAQAIARRAGGRLEITGRPTGGTEVRVTLPPAAPMAIARPQTTYTGVAL